MELKDKYHSVEWDVAEVLLNGLPYIGVAESGKDGECIAVTGPKDGSPNRQRYVDIALLVSIIPEITNELAFLKEQFDLLLKEHGEPFGWGELTTERAGDIMHFVALFFVKEKPYQLAPSEAFRKIVSSEGFPSSKPRTAPQI